MIIDLHFHTEKYSPCSKINLEDGLKKAKLMGLDAICITEHDIIANYLNIADLEKKYHIKIFVGTEIYTLDGDILCYGIDNIPDSKISASELTAYVNSKGGATIAAHPFRNNNRGIKNKIADLPHLDAVEAFNGNTSYENNMKAYDISQANHIPITGSSDCHKLDNIGIYATEFSENEINTSIELAKELRNKNFTPVKYDALEKGYKPCKL